MAEKLLYLQNGVYKRKEITNGIMTYNNNAFSSVAPTKNGSFYIKLDENGMSFEEKESALQTVNPSDLNYSHITTPHIIYVNNNNFNTLTLPSEQGHYMLVNAETPTFEKLTVSPSDMGINKTDTGSALMMITGDNSITTIPIMKNNWVNALFYNNAEKRWVASQITLFQQCGWQGDVAGFGIPLIKSDKSNTFITLPKTESGDYLFAYSGNSTPTLKKIDTSLLGLKAEGLIINNGQTFSALKSKTAGNYYLKFSGTNGIPSLEAVPASVAKISSKLVFTAASTPLTNELNTTDISCEGTNNFNTGKTFLITYEFDLYTSDIEGVIAGFKAVPILKINYETTQIGEVCLGNPNNYIHVSGSSIITATTTAINLTFLLENDQVASYTFANNIKLGLVEI